MFSSGKGTSRPTRYIVFRNESEFTGDEIQKTTYYLTYLYTSFTKALSVPPLVQYAQSSRKTGYMLLKYLDNNRGQVFGERELNEEETNNLNRRIEVADNLKNNLYFV